MNVMMVTDCNYLYVGFRPSQRSKLPPLSASLLRQMCKNPWKIPVHLIFNVYKKSTRWYSHCEEKATTYGRHRAPVTGYTVLKICNIHC
jgi:hypothetical protein